MMLFGCLLAAVTPGLGDGFLIGALFHSLWVRITRRCVPLAVLPPKVLCKYEGINIALLPPFPFLASGMDVVVVYGA